MVFGMQELLDRGFVPLCGSGFELIILGSKAGAPHQVSDQSDIVICHLFSPRSEHTHNQTFQCWETGAGVLGKSRASSLQQRSLALAILCKRRNHVGSARAFVLLMTYCRVIMVVVH